MTAVKQDLPMLEISQEWLTFVVLVRCKSCASKMLYVNPSTKDRPEHAMIIKLGSKYSVGRTDTPKLQAEVAIGKHLLKKEATEVLTSHPTFKCQAFLTLFSN